MLIFFANIAIFYKTGDIMTLFGVIGAMEVEIALLLQKMEETAAVKTKQIASLTFYEGEIGKAALVLVKSGIGTVNAALCAQILISEFKVSHLINTGIAGALSKNLGVLDVVLSTDAVYHDFRVTGFGYKPCIIPGMKKSVFTADSKLIEKAKNAYTSAHFVHNLYTGRIATGNLFVDQTSEKARIISDVSDLDGISPIAVEMEGAAIAHVAYVNQIPFLIIRSISDTADESIEKGEYKEEEAAKVSSFIVQSILED